MAFLLEVKKRIQTTDNTRKITRAMQLVAANKMKTFQQRALSSRRYAWALLDGLTQAHASFRDMSFGEVRTDGATLFVLITSDKGLCGALNHKLIDALFDSEHWKATASEQRLLITIGRKSYEAARREGFPVAAKFEGVKEDMTPLDSLEVINEILGYWERRECKEIILVSPHYINPFITHSTMKTYLPFSDAMIRSHLQWREPEKALSGNASEGRYVKDQHIYYEPTEDDVVEVLALQLAQTLFVQAFYELKASEYSSRMVAMKQATEAADDMIKQLTLDFNKARQAQITQQLAELVGGSEAMSKA